MRLGLLLAGLAFAAGAGCDAVGPVNQPPPPASDAPASLATVLADAGAFGVFARVAAEVELPAGATVLAPSDEAFALMSPESLDGLRRAGIVGKLARRHVLSHPLDPAALADGDLLHTVEGSPLTVRVTDEGEVFLDGARLGRRLGVTEAGPVYALDQVLRSHLSVAERMAAAPLLSRSAALFADAGIDLSQPGTYFVPIDLGYDLAFGGYGAFARPENRSLVKKTLQALVLPGAPQSAAQLQARGTVPTAAGSPLRIAATDGLTVLGLDESRLLVADIPADGATMHLVGPPPQGHLTLLERIAFVPSLSSFSALLSQSGVRAALQGDGPFTVFATQNDAFDALGVQSREALATERPLGTLVAGFQVSPQDIPSQALVTPAAFSSLTDQQIRVRPNPLTDDPASIAGASLTDRVDLPAANGRIHVVGRLLNPDVSIYDQLVLSGFGLFRRVAQLAGHQELLSSGTPVTVIAPRRLSPQLVLPAFACRAREIAGDHIVPRAVNLSPLTNPFDTLSEDVFVSPAVGAQGGFLELNRRIVSAIDVTIVSIGGAETDFVNLTLSDGSILHGVDARMRYYSRTFPATRTPVPPPCSSG